MPSRVELGAGGVTLRSPAGRATTIPWSELACVTLVSGRHPRVTWVRVDGATEAVLGAIPDVFGLLTDVRRWAPHVRVES